MKKDIEELKNVPEMCEECLLRAVIQRIQHILSDTTLDDPECFQRIEDIVCTFEGFYMDTGSRHDF